MPKINDVQIVKADIVTDNGVIHVIKQIFDAANENDSLRTQGQPIVSLATYFFHTMKS